MHRERVEPGWRAPSAVESNSAEPPSESPRTTLPACQVLPALSVVAVKAAAVDCQTTAALISSPTGTAAASRERSADDLVRTSPPRAHEAPGWGPTTPHRASPGASAGRTLPGPPNG